MLRILRAKCTYSQLIAANRGRGARLNESVLAATGITTIVGVRGCGGGAGRECDGE